MNARPIRCLVTAGPTREYFDPVRFLSNPSSGKMGYALAQAAVALGWEVDLISGPVALPTPEKVRRINVVTGQQMYEATAPLFEKCDVLIMTAAIMDYRPSECAPRKIKKNELSMVIEMEPVIDVLATLAAQKKQQLVVGFAAETDNIEAYAQRKLVEKRADFIVANRIGGDDGAFGRDDNQVQLLKFDGTVESIGPMLKVELAEQLIARFAAELEKRSR